MALFALAIAALSRYPTGPTGKEPIMSYTYDRTIDASIDDVGIGARLIEAVEVA